MTDDSTDRDGTDAETSTRATELTYEIGEDEQVSEAVVRATAALTNTPIIDLNPLYDAVDPDLLDGLFADSGQGPAPIERSLDFGFAGCHVSATEKTVVVREGEQRPE